MPLIFCSNSSPLPPDGKSLRKWVKHQNMDDMELLYQWDEKYLSLGELCTSYLENWWALEVQKDLEKIEKVKMVEISTHLGEVGFLHQIHKQIHQIGQYSGVGSLVHFLKCG